MPLINRLAISIIVIVVTTATAAGSSADLDENLSMFADLIGKQWEGHFEDADEPMTLYMEWEPIIGGAAVQMKGWSSSSDMTRLNIYYWDREKKQVYYLAMTSNGYVATGTATGEDSVLTFTGRQVGPDGTARDTKGCWELLPDGNVRVTGCANQGDQRKPGHRILYTPTESD